MITVIGNTSDVFVTEVRYHKSCWKSYTRPVGLLCDDDQNSRIHNAEILEVKQMFLKHVQKVILELNEPKTLQDLLEDSKAILHNFGFPTKSVKSAVIKTLIQKEYGDNVGFHLRYHRNQSALLYDKTAASSYIEAAICSWGIIYEQLLNTIARFLNDRLRNDPVMRWPPNIAELENDQEPDHCLKMFLGWLKKPALKYSSKCSSPDIHVLASLMKSFLSGKRSIFKTKLSCTIHSMTRCRELVDIFKKIEIGISYKDVTKLYATWGKKDVESSCCNFEIAYDLPGTAVMHNDDFKDDNLTGANASHRTNVMFLQPENQARVYLEICCPVLVNQKDLKIISDQQNKVRPYETIKAGVPPVRKSFNIAPKTTKPMQVEQMKHSTLRLDNEHKPIPSKEQTIGSFAGFQAPIQSKPQKSKSYYFLTLPTTPYKSEIHEAMSRLADVIKERRMIFLQLVDDQPVYALIAQLWNEYRKAFEKSLPVLGPFHTQYFSSQQLKSVFLVLVYLKYWSQQV